MGVWEFLGYWFTKTGSLKRVARKHAILHKSIDLQQTGKMVSGDALRKKADQDALIQVGNGLIEHANGTDHLMYIDEYMRAYRGGEDVYYVERFKE